MIATALRGSSQVPRMKNKKFADPDETKISILTTRTGKSTVMLLWAKVIPRSLKNSYFEGVEKPKDLKGGSKRPSAADFMSEDSDEEDEALNDESGDDGSDEDILDTAEQHSDGSGNEVFSTARQYADDASEQSNGSGPAIEGLDIASEEEDEDILDDEEGSDSEKDQDEAKESEEEDDDDDDNDDETSRRAELRKIMK